MNLLDYLAGNVDQAEKQKCSCGAKTPKAKLEVALRTGKLRRERATEEDDIHLALGTGAYTEE